MALASTNLLLALLFVGTLMGAIDLAIIGPALPAIQVDFGLQQRQLAALYNAYILCQLIGTPLLAKMADRYGPRTIYIFSIGLFALGSLALVMADGITALYTGRAIQGFGAGGIFPAAAAVIGMRLPIEKRGPALGVLSMVWGLAFLIGPVLGGILLRFAWQWLFLVNLPIAAILILGAVKLLPGESEHEPKPFDVAGALTMAVALIALVMAVSSVDTNAPLQSLLSPHVGGGLLVVCVLVPWFWRTEKRAADPVIKPALFGSRQIITSCVISCGVGALQSGSVFYPALAVAALGITVSNASFIILPGVIAATLCSPVAGKLINVVGTRAIILVCIVLVFCSLLIYGLSELRLMVFLSASIVSGIGMSGLLGAPLRFIALTESSTRDRAAAQGLLSVFTSIGRLLGAAIIGAVATSRGGGIEGYQAAFVVMAMLAGLLMPLAITLKSRTAEQVSTL